jgi:hypothetical protein
LTRGVLSAEYRLLHSTQGERWFVHTGRVARRDATGRTLADCVLRANGYHRERPSGADAVDLVPLGPRDTELIA